MSSAVEVSSDSFPTIIEAHDENQKQIIIDALKTVFDPEIPIDIYELGLIYRVIVKGSSVHVEMSLTSPGCPVAGEMPGMVHEAMATIDDLKEIEVELVWDPPWNPDMMSEDARLYLGF